MIRMKRPTTLSILLMTLLAAAWAHAKPPTTAQLINQAGMQRMLSQRIAKAYFFLGAQVRPDKARKQLKEALERFEANLNLLNRELRAPEMKEVLAFETFAFEEFKALVLQPYSPENGALVLDLSETLLETSHDIVLKLEAHSKKQVDKVVALAGRQRMLAQRIAKFYIAYRLGFRDENSIRQLNQAVADFQEALKQLELSKRNTPQITAKLKQVRRYWNLVKGFFLDIKKGGLPITVFAATDKITDLMDDVTQAYVTTGEGKKS